MTREWWALMVMKQISLTISASDQGQRDCVRGRGGLLQGVQCHRERDQREGHPPQHQVGQHDSCQPKYANTILNCRLLAQTSLRNILGTKNLHEILSDRDSIAGAMQVTLNPIYVLKVKYFYVLAFTG